MNSSTTTMPADETNQARDIIELGLTLDPEARSETLARLIAASLHGGFGSTLERFAATGDLDAESALHELNELHVPLAQEGWIDALGRYILTAPRSRS